MMTARRTFGCVGTAVLPCLLATMAVVRAEKLPIRPYATADGLPHNTVMRIVQDSHGFLWFCTLKGLARFDGYTFKSYGVEQGLRGIVKDLLETRAGEYWVATLNGLYRFHPTPPLRGSQPMFELYPLAADGSNPGVNTLHEDRRGAIWAATNAGLYRMASEGGRWTTHLLDLAVQGKAANTVRVLELLEDCKGAMWISLPQAGVRELRPDGQTNSYTTLGSPGTGADSRAFEGMVGPMLEDHAGRLWLGSDRGLSLLVRRPGSAQLALVRTYTTKNGLRNDNVGALWESTDGNLWVGTSAGLSRFCPGSNCGGQCFRTYVTASLGRFGAWTLVDDQDGNLWIGNETGALRLARDGFTTYDEMDGLGSSRVLSVAESSTGHLYVVTLGAHGGDFSELDGSRFHTVSPRSIAAGDDSVVSSRPIGLQDQAGDWWVLTDRGLLQYTGVKRLEEVAHRQPSAVYTSRNGLPPAQILSLYGDSRGDLWAGSLFVTGTAGALSRWQRSTRTFHRFGTAEGLTASTTPIAFCEDRAGDLWVGFQHHDLACYRGGRFRVFTTRDGLPAGSIWSLYPDHEGRLWVATTEGGVARIDHPEAEHPRFAAYTTADGISSDQVQAITEDRWGRIYMLTDRGVDRLDPKTGWVKHYTSADGLVSSSHWGVAFRDRQGDLWFGTLEGLSRLTPQPDEAGSPPPIRIGAIRVRGDPFPVSELGQTSIAPLVLQPNLNQIQIDYASFNFAVGDVLRYQYKLEGADRDWNKITDQRTVNYATLSPGKYRFLVRAINWKGMTSSEPAVLAFRVLAPVWQRWWFMTVLALAAGCIIYALHRNRVVRLLELERIRIRIATDLHDDIGASLSQIAVLSEVAQVELARGDHHAEQPLVRIAGVSRELVDSMSEIVWAVNPQKDRLRDLVQHMREFADDVFVAHDIKLQFRAADGAQEIKLGMDARRQVFLIFKECVHNIARHSGCRRVEVDMRVDGESLMLRISDDGKGFDCARGARSLKASHGHGLESMHRRAQSLGGCLELRTAADQGVTVVLRVPIHQRLLDRLHPPKLAG